MCWLSLLLGLAAGMFLGVGLMSLLAMASMSDREPMSGKEEK